MKPFHFRLERARRWQEQTCAAEERNLRAALEIAVRSDTRLQQARAEASAAEQETRSRVSLDSAEVRSWAAYRRVAFAREKAIRREKSEAEAAVRVRREILIEVRRRLKLIETLRSREQAAHRTAESRELEELAQESFANTQHRKRT